MKKKFEKLLNNLELINDVTDPDYVRYNSFGLFLNIVGFSLLIAIALTIYEKQYSSLPIIFLIVLLTHILGYLLKHQVIKKEHINRTIRLFNILITFMCPVIYVTSGGLYSSTMLWLLLVVVYTCAVMRRKEKIICLSAQLIVLAITIHLDYSKVISPLGSLSRRNWFIATIVVMITVSVLIGVYISYILREHEEIIKKYQESLKDLQKQNEKIEELAMQYKEQKEIAETASKAQSDFLANMSHEIRTPLNAVTGLSEVICRINDIEEIHKLTGNIVNASKVLLNIINDILDYQSIKEGKLAIVPQAYKSDMLYIAFHNIAVPRLEAKGIKWDIKTDKIPEVLNGDILRIQQILSNLLSNAIKYTESGNITYTLNYDYEKENLIFSVEDTGIGIKKEDIPYIFDRFTRFDLKKNRNIQGTGLGLSLTKKMIEAMNGTIEVDSKYGEGSTFTVSIPQEEIKDTEIVKKLNTKKKTYDFKDVKALYVDDTPTNHLVVDKLMLDTNITIVHKFSPKELSEYNKEFFEQFNILLLDYLMPDMDGISLYNHIKSLGISLPALILTADVTKESEKEFKENGFSGYITKPIDKNLLCEEIERLTIANH